MWQGGPVERSNLVLPRITTDFIASASFTFVFLPIPDSVTVIGKKGNVGGSGGVKQGPSAYERAKAAGAINDLDRKSECRDTDAAWKLENRVAAPKMVAAF